MNTTMEIPAAAAAARTRACRRRRRLRRHEEEEEEAPRNNNKKKNSDNNSRIVEVIDLVNDKEEGLGGGGERILLLEVSNNEAAATTMSLKKRTKRRRIHHYYNATNTTTTTNKNDDGNNNNNSSIATRTPSTPLLPSLSNDDDDDDMMNMPIEEEEPLIYLSADFSENGIVTGGIGKLLAKLPRRRRRTIANYSTVHHIRQRDTWSCGFRNLQMIMSAMLPLLSPDHSYFSSQQRQQQRRRRHEDAAYRIPSLRQLQRRLEASWDAGFDPKGAQHYHHQVVGKPSKIGAVEVSSLLSHWNIDSTVVQFIKCRASRSLLVPFCRAYFSKQQQQQQQTRTNHHSAAVSSNQIVQSLLKELAVDESSGGAKMTTTPAAVPGCCDCPVLPLYLQWEGHSVTIVGAEDTVTTNNNDDDDDKTNLLVLDPMKDGTKVKQALERGDVAPLRLLRHRLEQKDCQVILCSVRPLFPNEREQRKKRVDSVTAAHEAVLQAQKNEIAATPNYS